MTKSSRLFIMILLVGVGIYSLAPSLQYYFFTDDTIRELVESANQRSTLAVGDETSLDLAEEVDLEAELDIADLEAELDAAVDPLSDPETKVAYDRAKAAWDRSIRPGLDLSGGLSIDVEADFAELSRISSVTLEDFDDASKQDAVDRIVTKIQNRIDAAGVSDITIRKQPNYRLTIQIPGETSSERVQSLVATTGRMELKIVDEQSTAFYEYNPERDGDKPVHPDDSLEVAFLYEPNELGERVRTTPLVLERDVLLSGDTITDAGLEYNQYGEPVVGFTLSTAGAKAFSRITAENIGRRLAILLDGNVLSAPAMNVHIPDGQGFIEGGFSADTARDLGLILRSGSLPVPIRIISEDIIAPKLGADLKNQAFQAFAISLIAITIFMILFYRASGIIATLALLLNGLLIIAFLASFGLSLSIAGIAGLLLTIGMSIDANVIIFSRIREELLEPRNTLADAIRKAYARAFWTIFDANVTTLIAAFMLFYYGTGFLQGFATTLFVGILVSMFTSLFVTRLIFDFLIDYGWLKRYTPLVI